MPISLTYNPRQLKTGDLVGFLGTSDNSQSLQFNCRPMWCRVVSILEYYTATGPNDIRRHWKLSLKVDGLTNSLNDKTEFTATETSPIFTTRADMEKYIKEKVKDWARVSDAHNKRRQDLEGLLYDKK